MRSIGHETGRRSGRPVLSTRQLVELVPEGLGRAAAIVRQNPQGGVVHARRDIALAVERSWIEIGHDTDVEHPGDVSRQMHEGSGISERQALTHERVDLLLGGHVEEFASHDCQIELRFGFRFANPLAVTLLCANRHQEQRCDDRSWNITSVLADSASTHLLRYLHSRDQASWESGATRRFERRRP